MELVIADAEGRDLRSVADYDLDMAFGSDENDFELTIDATLAPPPGGYAYADGTEYGGTVDSVERASGSKVAVCRGRTWHGVLAGKVLVPDAGSSHIVMDGPAQACLRSVIDRTGLGGLFSAPDGAGSGSVSGHRMERFCDAYSGVRAMLRASGLKLSMRREGGKVVMAALPVADLSSEVDSDLVEFVYERTHRRVNHLVCAGAGEGAARAVVHVYADAEGAVSQEQTLFGADEVAALYDYSNADADELLEAGLAKLAEMQGEGTAEVSVSDDLDADVGDLVSARDWETGQSVTAEVAKKVVKASGGAVSYSYEVGRPPASAGASLSGSSESSGAGASYKAGKGLSIVGATISAEVDAADLAEVSDRARSAAADALAASQAAAESVREVEARAPVALSRDGRDISLSLDTVDAAGVNSWFA